MQIAPFALERYFARHEFTARYLLSSSDCEALSMAELLDLADAESRRLWDELRLGYTESAGHPLLREAIAELYDETIGPQNVRVLVPEEGIFLAMHALLSPGAHVVCAFPAYQSLYEVARSIGCEVSTWEPDEARGWRFDLGHLEGLLRDSTELVVVNFPHNPTGHLPDEADYRALVDLLRPRGIHLLSDEMYRFLELDRRTTLPSGCEIYDRALTLFGLSKSYGLPGLRIGWLAGQDADLLARISVLKDYTTICASAPSELLAIVALRSGDRILEPQRQRIRRNLAAFEAFVADHDDLLRYHRPAGGSVCFPRLLAPEGSAAFCQRLVREAGIMLVPSAMFHYGDAHVRVGLGRDDLPAVLERLEAYLRRRTG